MKRTDFEKAKELEQKLAILDDFLGDGTRAIAEVDFLSIHISGRSSVGMSFSSFERNLRTEMLPEIRQEIMKFISDYRTEIRDQLSCLVEEEEEQW